ncbi:hypothetical protein OK348_17495 [Flavobacterium sp. MXW15]|uniref:Sugar transporter n=1 Tax=Xanthomonas chitinilytica TaxID=2989819 RepID=A0ABT3K0M1_9XANT|nr:hypothetical protein [Xanthomonas sp. H13-6]MCW4456575.1 hypothetical protein [Flavobacterium sp. MXW15]MCW4474277.1 hypothetical protein [Xanthomonas sp. H13-6]
MNTAVAVPRRHGVIATLILLWNVLGLTMFWLQLGMSPEAVAALPAPQRAVYEATPALVNIAFGVAVVAGLLGALGLLLRRGWALPCFVLSLLAVLVQIGTTYAATPAWEAYGPAGLVMPVVLVVVGLLQIRYARNARVRGWLR